MHSLVRSAQVLASWRDNKKTLCKSHCFEWCWEFLPVDIILNIDEPSWKVNKQQKICNWTTVIKYTTQSKLGIYECVLSFWIRIHFDVFVVSSQHQHFWSYSNPILHKLQSICRCDCKQWMDKRKNRVAFYYYYYYSVPHLNVGKFYNFFFFSIICILVCHGPVDQQKNLIVQCLFHNLSIILLKPNP